MEFSREKKKIVYQRWRSVFWSNKNFSLRQPKPIQTVVKQHDPAYLQSEPNLIAILQSLLKDRVFENEEVAKQFFPELFPENQSVQVKTRSSLHTEGSVELLTSLENLFFSGEYSDLTILCCGREYHVHKAIVCPRSEFFAAAVRGGFKEAEDGIIDLSDDDPGIVHLMLYYLYHLKYEVKQDGNPTSQDSNGGKCTNSPLTVHIKVYCLADKYFIYGLKALATRHFEDALAMKWCTADFLEAARLVYSSTPEAEKGLRSAIFIALEDDPGLLDLKEAQNVFREETLLMYDFVMHLRKEGII